LFPEHLPFKSTQVPHRPNIVPPPIPLLPTYDLRIQHLRDRLGHGLVQELHPSFSKISLSVFLPLFSRGS
jgi:hypothetical protein